MLETTKFQEQVVLESIALFYLHWWNALAFQIEELAFFLLFKKLYGPIFGKTWTKNNLLQATKWRGLAILESTGLLYQHS